MTFMKFMPVSACIDAVVKTVNIIHILFMKATVWLMYYTKQSNINHLPMQVLQTQYSIIK